MEKYKLNFYSVYKKNIQYRKMYKDVVITIIPFVLFLTITNSFLNGLSSALHLFLLCTVPIFVSLMVLNHFFKKYFDVTVLSVILNKHEERNNLYDKNFNSFLEILKESGIHTMNQINVLYEYNLYRLENKNEVKIFDIVWSCLSTFVLPIFLYISGVLKFENLSLFLAILLFICLVMIFSALMIDNIKYIFSGLKNLNKEDLEKINEYLSEIRLNPNLLDHQKKESFFSRLRKRKRRYVK